MAGVTADGALIPSSSVGNNNTWLDLADRVILEVNSWQPAELDGMHDIYYGAALPPDRAPLRILTPSDRIGVPYLRCAPEKIVAVVLTDAPDYATPPRPADDNSQLAAGHLLDFLTHEVKHGRLPATLPPLQSGVGNITNAVLARLDGGPFPSLTAYSEVVHDGMLRLLRSGAMTVASATGFSLSEDGLADLRANIADYRHKIILRPQEISNHPEVVRRLGCLAMNGMIEADLYGNVNSTHVMGSSMMNGIGGSGDFARNAHLAIFLSASTAKNGAISCLVPMVSHVDHTEHDVHIIVTEQGVADLRGLPPRRRAQQIISRCAHPDYRPALQDYLDRALAAKSGQAHSAPARRGAVVALAVPARRHDAARLSLNARRPEQHRAQRAAPRARAATCARRPRHPVPPATVRHRCTSAPRAAIPEQMPTLMAVKHSDRHPGRHRDLPHSSRSRLAGRRSAATRVRRPAGVADRGVNQGLGGLRLRRRLRARRRPGRTARLGLPELGPRRTEAVDCSRSAAGQGGPDSNASTRDAMSGTGKSSAARARSGQLRFDIHTWQSGRSCQSSPVQTASRQLA